MIGDSHSLTAGYVARHVPRGSGLGVPVAVLDISQDFLLAHLANTGVFELVAFKGGTALRKLYAGSQGRFSTDIDLAVRDVTGDRIEIAQLVAEACNVQLGPFTFVSHNLRNRWQVAVQSEFGNPDITIKLDVGAPTWMTVDNHSFVPTPIHARYGFTLPDIPAMRLEEILAEKIARLARKATARDAADLIWAATTSPFSQFDRPLVRRLAALKIWVDNNGVQPGWDRAIGATPLDMQVFFSRDRDWDDEGIGMLTGPPPSIAELEGGLFKYYNWLRELSTEETRWSSADPRARGSVLKAMRELHGGALSDVHVF